MIKFYLMGLILFNVYATPNPVPSIYTDFDSYFDSLQVINPNWIESKDDRDS